MPNEQTLERIPSVTEIIELEVSDEIKKILIESKIDDQKHRNNLEEINKTGFLEIKKAKSLFWFGTGFVALISTILTLVLGELFGFIRLGEEQDHQIKITERKFERDMIQQAISENDEAARIDALRLLIKADLLPGLTETELDDYNQKLEGRSVPNVTTTSGFVLNENDQQLANIVGPPGSVQLSRVPTPFPMKLDWDLSKETNFVSFSSYGACALKRALEQIDNHYGDRVHELGISRLAGTYNVRKLRGSDRPSIHAFGTAIDLYSEANKFRDDASKAKFAGKEYEKMIDIFEAEGFISQGRKTGIDWAEFRVSLDTLEKREDPSSCGIE